MAGHAASTATSLHAAFGIEEEDVPATADATAIAVFYTTVIEGSCRPSAPAQPFREERVYRTHP